MKFRYFFGRRDGYLQPTFEKGDNLPYLVELSAVNRTKSYMYNVYEIIERFISFDLAKISTHCNLVVIDDVETMLKMIEIYIFNSEQNCFYQINKNLINEINEIRKDI